MQTTCLKVLFGSFAYSEYCVFTTVSIYRNWRTLLCTHLDHFHNKEEGQRQRGGDEEAGEDREQLRKHAGALVTNCGSTLSDW